jgi:DNA replication ATP-dependent helicase Dna2
MSPLPSIQEEAHQSSTEEPADVIMETEQPAEEAPLPPSSKAASSDYGDFDDDVFDDTVFGELEAPQPILHMETGSFQGIPKSSTHSQSAAAGASSNTLRMAEATSGAENDDDDEFADSDLEMFAADLEHIASKYDTPTMASATTTQNQHAAEVPAIVSHQQESLAQSEDEFGDDFDEEDLALAEETATQAQTHGQTQAAYSEPTQSTLPPTVRTYYRQ